MDTFRLMIDLAIVLSGHGTPLPVRVILPCPVDASRITETCYVDHPSGIVYLEPMKEGK